MKRLNRKGFTLIELLAIIVILAIILVIAIPEILDTMDNSRESSLHSSSIGVADWWENAMVSDTLITAADERLVYGAKVIGASTTIESDTWYCIANLVNYGGKNIFEVAELSANDINNSTTVVPNQTGDTITITPSTCSAVKLDSAGNVTVLLIAKDTGKFNVSDNVVTYALSSASGAMIGATITTP